jgi:hypothetical protein
VAFDFAFAFAPTLDFGVHFDTYRGGLTGSSGSSQLKITTSRGNPPHAIQPRAKRQTNLPIPMIPMAIRIPVAESVPKTNNVFVAVLPVSIPRNPPTKLRH